MSEPQMSDEAVQRATGKGWQEWFQLLDGWGGVQKTHKEIADHVYESFQVDGWWAQAVAVGYERARGLRATHQKADGFVAGVSRTFPASVKQLYAAWTEPAKSKWLPEQPEFTTVRPDISLRGKVQDNGRLSVNFYPKTPGKAQCTIQIEKLADEAAVVRTKERWKKAFDQLAEQLG